MEIPYYRTYVSKHFLNYLRAESKAVPRVLGLREIGSGGGLESVESLTFLCELYDLVKGELAQVLAQRELDRRFIDQQTRVCFEFNRSLKIDFLDARYQTVFCAKDAQGRVVVGPQKNAAYHRASGAPVARIPTFLQGHHVTLFGPPDDAKLSINAMNAFHRKLKDEPSIVSELLENYGETPKWGADDEDSKTPLRKDLVDAGVNLTSCFEGDIAFTDPISKKQYALKEPHLSLPIKRFVGLALPCLFLLYKDNPLPLHLYDFALHLYRNWHNPKALAFYVPKLENEEEARYLRLMLHTAEKLIQKIHPSYQIGTIRLLIVLENPRAVFRINEMMDELYPYFAGASLGWHDYLASTARLFKEDSNYRIPVKADPNIVIRHIKASHDLLSEVVGARQGIKVGGMYGVLPIGTDQKSPSFQVAIKGFIKDTVTQLKRNLDGFWVAHPDFVRLGLAIVSAWECLKKGDPSKLERLATSLLDKKYHAEIIDFIHKSDVIGLDYHDPLYPRSLVVADVKESAHIANNHPEEVRYNVFQALQYLADWLSGNGCVALPAHIDGVSVRVMDDLATLERSRWEVWHELHHKRFSLEEFLKITHEELHFIRKDLSNVQKIVQVKWDDRTKKWYEVAFHLMIQLMTSKDPPEFASELLLPFTIESIRQKNEPLKEAQKIHAEKYALDPYIERFSSYFAICGNMEFARILAHDLSLDMEKAEHIIKSFDKNAILDAAHFHGDIGEHAKTLDSLASQEQALVSQESEETKTQLRALGEQYRHKFGMKFLISAQGRSGKEILADLLKRYQNTEEQELINARNALFEISLKRLSNHPATRLREAIEHARNTHNIVGAMVSISSEQGSLQTLCFGDEIRGEKKVTRKTRFQLASLSKMLASSFALEYFRKSNIPLHTPVNSIFEKTSSIFRIKSLDDEHPEWADKVTIAHLLSHCAINMHYVNGIPACDHPRTVDLLQGHAHYDYSPVGALYEPGTSFHYSGGGFLILQHLLESRETHLDDMIETFFKRIGMENFTFDQKSSFPGSYASGYHLNGERISKKAHPAFAAGGLGTSHDISTFLNELTKAYHDTHGQGPISHDTAVQMLFGKDLGSRQFMGVDMGLGIFCAEAGPNRLAIHQGANEGFRALSIHCYQGPDCGKGLVILCNGELNGVLFVAQVAQIIFNEWKMAGVELERFKNNFIASSISKEQVVNKGYKELIFDAFLPDLPEKIIKNGPLDPLAQFNLAVHGKIVEVSNQRFARAENLLSPFMPAFDPELFGRQGKIMDSWETARHNQKPSDDLIFELKEPSTIGYVSLSTQFHLGNHPQSVKIRGRQSESEEWQDIIQPMELCGHSLKKIKSLNNHIVFKTIHVSIMPDGGLSRLGLFNETLPEHEKAQFLPQEKAHNILYSKPIPHMIRPPVPQYCATQTEIDKNWDRALANEEIDVASNAFGGTIVSVSNQHYGPASQILSPFLPIHMFDGLESARSREKSHYEEVVVALGRPSRIHRIEIDFSYFVHNNPRELSIEAASSEGEWITIVPLTAVKAYAGNQALFTINAHENFTKVKVLIFPDGGFNRLHVYAYNHL